MKIKIYKPAKSATQSGKFKFKWIVEFEEEINHRSIDPQTKWVSTNSTESQLRFSFNSKEEAVDFAKKQSEKHNLQIEIQEQKISQITKKCYADNFL